MSHTWTMAQGEAVLVGEIVCAHADVMRDVMRADWGNVCGSGDVSRAA